MRHALQEHRHFDRRDLNNKNDKIILRIFYITKLSIKFHAHQFIYLQTTKHLVYLVNNILTWQYSSQ
jgi:hypothetical protein